MRCPGSTHIPNVPRVGKRNGSYCTFILSQYHTRWYSGDMSQISDCSSFRQEGAKPPGIFSDVLATEGGLPPPLILIWVPSREPQEHNSPWRRRGDPGAGKPGVAPVGAV